MSSNPSRALPALAVQSGRAIDYPEADPRDPEPSPPVAPVKPSVTTIHGESRIDEYAWLRDRDDPAVAAYLDAENRHTESVMRGTEELQERLYQEMRGRITA